MYTHAGNNRIIRTRDIIGIFDLDTSTVSKITKKYISEKEFDETVLDPEPQEEESVEITQTEDPVEEAVAEVVADSI